MFWRVFSARGAAQTRVLLVSYRTLARSISRLDEPSQPGDAVDAGTT